MIFDKISKTKVLLLSIMVISLIIGFFAIWKLSFISPAPEGDAYEYDKTAILLATHGEIDMSFQYIRAPGYSFFLAAIWKLFGHNYVIIYWLQFFLLGLTGIIAFFICKKHLNQNNIISFLSALTIIFWPYFILHAKLLLVETLYSFLLLLFTYQLLEYVKNPKIQNAFLAGLFIGLATLTRPVPLLLPFWLAIAIFLYYLIKNKFDKQQKYIISKKIIFSMFLSVFIFLSTLAPWIIFASYKSGKFVPVASTFSDVYKGSNKSFTNEWNYYKTPGYEPGTEVTLKKIATIKIKNIFRFWKSGANGYQAEALVKRFPITKYAIIMYEIIFYIILFLALLAVFFTFKEINIFLLWAIVSYNWLFHATLHTQPRYNLPTIPIVIILAFFTFNKILSYYQFYTTKNATHPKTKTL
ncbi:MAG: Oligosaccharyl transferase STT3 subunit [Candidatus Falkowbacteria bacterium GW2011_GWC2_38_22]|uniref:Oligosaccharyl transferase STT3 subunit n=1 Tax=Candidatus Falkowbacteria bacterium GW2011_GWE1_38_31 TaxID=1618638 RepID=A0A0G0JS48_9BACT|nr:MAG: Oligosaccharyl transferase STT3 subunit [Candidatus Falkowbacteria bacterium GW2011_GWF2_38_1205]KKQ61493.1 MAG: Oligosaccharyl transferase STT3 subunit [Candidatus Falkowbacteria bacterium GW2011_GWC2_38_22]KKQ63614.1 MAG: Oligosaccharyl transferase STT3 subunit [Candidatus Falkowbacteria bacterium GW2011_GWF1_38_22]KKQ65766.1 MAG: Oligosaccharyl transferase STT3 subunit [Candidatus Falkowbacteria bacterium GW2011_GWE2_38_254]KKQ70383.1 MAG: Oligosaccharyl transferase STT3 subunit [Can